MNKKLFLLPVIGGFLLSGCQFKLFGKTITLFEKDNSSKGSELTEFVFNPAEIATPYFKDEPAVVQEFEYNGYEFYDRYTYVTTAKDDKKALWFYNVWDGNYDLVEVTKDDGTTSTFKDAKEDTKYAFISNKTPFEKGIKKVEIVTNAGTGGLTFFVSFGSSAFTEAATSGTSRSATGGSSSKFTVTSDGKSNYFAISTSGTVGKSLKNLMVNSIKLYF